MTNPGIYQLFVYGSLRSGFGTPAYEYISRFFDLVGEGRVRGKLYDLGEYPAAVAVKEDAFIIGELYTIKNESEFAWAVGQLDDYEGVTTEPGEPQLFRREPVEVFNGNAVTTAWIYWYNGDVSGRTAIASGDIMDYRKR